MKAEEGLFMLPGFCLSMIFCALAAGSRKVESGFLIGEGQDNTALSMDFGKR